MDMHPLSLSTEFGASGFGGPDPSSDTAIAFAVTRGTPNPVAGDVSVLLRDGTRVSAKLLDAAADAPTLARVLVGDPVNAPALHLLLADGSTLMLPARDILGLHVPAPSLQPGAALQTAIRTQTQAADQDETAWLADSGSLPSAAERVETYRVGRHRVIRIRDFLPVAIAERLRRYAVSREADYTPSRVCSNDPEYRKSVVLFSFPEYEAMFRAALTEALPEICSALAIAAFEARTIECQLTATRHGGYFKAHTDNAAKMAYRKITFCYYLQRQPAPFAGGEIRFMDHNPYAAAPQNPRSSLEFSPEHNSIILFDSSCYHQVQDVSCPGGSFADARFTLNGWIGTERPKPAAEAAVRAEAKA